MRLDGGTVLVSSCGEVWVTTATLTEKGKANAQEAINKACGTDTKTVTVANK